jgi:hypothetical protein
LVRVTVLTKQIVFATTEHVKTAEGLATASLALDNMIRGGNIGNPDRLPAAGIEFNKDTQMYSAVKKDKSMTKVYEAEAKLKERLGEQLGTNIIQGYLAGQAVPQH